MPEVPDYAHLIASSAESFFVTDKDGNILIVNPVACMLLDLTKDQLVGVNVKELVKKGLYNRSTTLEAIEKKSTVTGVFRNRNGKSIMATSRPILDDAGNVTVVITNSLDTERVEEFVMMIEQERSLTDRYRTEVESLRNKFIEKDKIIFASDSMKNILNKLDSVATIDSTTILFGESGTGKDPLAKYIHKKSLRSKGPYIDVNCAAIPEQLMESELFGYEKGAFTGAASTGKIGLLELADKGTLFLDEIGELPIQLQSKLLRAIENNEIRRVGSLVGRKTNFRLIAATNRNLPKMITENKFRSDLYYRLNVIPIHIPPLRDRPEDIMVIADYFLNMFNAKYGREAILTETTRNAFLHYSWPGNVRELRNIVERLVITKINTDKDPMGIEENILGPPCQPQGGIDMPGTLNESSERALYIELANDKATLKTVVEQAERKYIAKVLRDCHQNVREAAERMGIHRTILYRKMKLSHE